MKLPHRSAGMVAVAVLAVAALSTAQANVFTVGADSSCTHRSLDHAIEAARASAGRDEIRLARNLVQQSALAIDVGADIVLSGGYNNCADTTARGVTRVRLLGPIDTDWLAQHAHGDGLRFESQARGSLAPASTGVLMSK
jgi:hypothetical protein